MNMCVCKLNNADGTATTGDVVIVPATQQQLTATSLSSGKDVLPAYNEAGFAKSIPAKLEDPVYKASANGDKSFGMIAGSD